MTYTKYESFFAGRIGIASAMIVKIQLDDLLGKRKRSFYWLSKQTGISYKTLWRLKNGKALGINFATLERICAALDCLPGDVITLEQIPPTETRIAKRAGRISADLEI